MLLFLLLVRVAADGDDADRGAGGVGNDNRLALPLPGGAGRPVAPPARDGGAAGGTAVHQGAAGRRVLLDALGPLRGADGLRGGHLTGGDVPVTTKPRTLTGEGQAQRLLPRRSGNTGSAQISIEKLEARGTQVSSVIATAAASSARSLSYLLPRWPPRGSGWVPCACSQKDKGIIPGFKEREMASQGPGWSVGTGAGPGASGLSASLQPGLQGQGLAS